MTDGPNLRLLDGLIAMFDHMEAGTAVGTQAESIVACLDQLKQRSAWTLGYARASIRLKALAVTFAAKHAFANARDLEALERMKAAFLELRSYVLADAVRA